MIKGLSEVPSRDVLTLKALGKDIYIYLSFTCNSIGYNILGTLAREWQRMGNNRVIEFTETVVSIILEPTISTTTTPPGLYLFPHLPARGPFKVNDV